MKTSNKASWLKGAPLPAKAETTATKEATEEAPEVTSAEIPEAEAVENANWSDGTDETPEPVGAASKEESLETPDEPEAPALTDVEAANWGEEIETTSEPETSSESDDGNESAPEVVEEAVTETPAEGDVTKIDPHLLTGARELGFSDEYSGKLHQAGLLENTMSRVLAESRASMSRTPASESPEKAPDTIELDADLYDEDTMEKIKAQNSVVESQHKTINELKEEKAQAETKSAQTAFNDYLSRLGDEWVPVFGKGHVEEESASYVNRMLLLEKSLEQGLGLEAVGKNADLSVVFDQGLRMAFPDHQTRLATDKLSKEVKSRAKQILSKPGNTKKVALSPVDAAVQELGEMEKARGWDLGGDEVTNDNWNS